METRELKEKLKKFGLNVVLEDCVVVEDGYGITIAFISMEHAFNLDTLCGNLRFFDENAKKEILDILVEYTSTPIKERCYEEKYYWKLKGDWSDEQVYLNFIVKDKGICIWDEMECESRKTQFTEKEFEEICVEHGLVKEAFDKEDIL